MAVRLTFGLEFGISSTTADEKDLGNLDFLVRSDAFAEGGSWKTIVPSGAVDVQYHLDNIATVRFLALRVTPVDENHPAPTLSVKFDDVGNTPILLSAPIDCKTSVLVVTTSGISALYVSNSGSYNAELTISVAGD